MDLLSSILQTNTEISFKEPGKLYFGLYPIKLVFDFEFVDYRCRPKDFVSVAKAYLNTSKLNYSVGRVRKESNLVTVFVADADVAQQLLTHIDLAFNISSVDTYLTAMEFPLTQARQDHLLNDGLFRGKNFKFRYKITIVDGMMRRHVNAVNELLKSVADDSDNFSLSIGVTHQLTRYTYLYNNYYYCNDLGHTVWIQLVDPKFIKKIQSIMNEP
jgi:hypothetical protein